MLIFWKNEVGLQRRQVWALAGAAARFCRNLRRLSQRGPRLCQLPQPRVWKVKRFWLGVRVPSIRHQFTLASAPSPSLPLSRLLPLAQYRFKCLRIYSGAWWEKESKFVNLMNGTPFLKTVAPQPPRVQLSSFSSLISNPHRKESRLKRRTPDSSFSRPGFK